MTSTDPNAASPADDSRSPRVRKISPPLDVPVYNCHAYVAPRNAQGEVVARAANLANVTGCGNSEREALQKLIESFKATIVRHVAASESIPWLEPPSPPEAGEKQRLLAVHL